MRRLSAPNLIDPAPAGIVCEAKGGTLPDKVVSGCSSVVSLRHNDVLLGNDGDDTLNGQGGADTVAGNEGLDVFNDPTDEIDEAFVLPGLGRATGPRLLPPSKCGD